MGDGNEMAAITVTITSDAADDKTAEVTLSVKCGTDDAIEEKMDAVAGKADFGEVDLGDIETAENCTADASATLGGEEKKATQVTFEVVVAGATGPTHTLTIDSITPGNFATAHAVKATIAVDSGELGNAATAAVTWHWHCAATMPASTSDYAAVDAADWQAAMKADGTSNADAIRGAHITDINLGNAAESLECVVRACATIDSSDVCGYQTVIVTDAG